MPSVLSAVGLPKAEALAKEGHKRRKGVEGEDELCVASIDAAGVGQSGRFVLVCADRGKMPRLHQTEGCVVWGSEPLP